MTRRSCSIRSQMWGLVLAAALGLGPATEPRVTIVAASTEDPLITALQGELGTLGFEAGAHAEPDESVSFAELRDIASAEGVAAAIWIAPDRSEVVVWVDDRGKGRAIVRELPTEAEGATDEVIVLRVVELLRASLREAEADQAATEQGPQPLPEPHPPLDPDDEPRRTWAADLGPAIAGAPGGIGASAHVAASVRYMPHHRIGVRLAALAPTLGPRVEAEGGSARISVAQVVAGPHVAFRHHERVVQPDAGLAVGLSIVRVDGRAEAPLVGQTDHVLGFTGRLGAGVAFVVAPMVALRLDAAIGVTLPGPQVAFEDRTVARWDQPYGLGAAALEFRWGSR